MKGGAVESESAVKPSEIANISLDPDTLKRAG
jgi:hypothetical protein